MATVRIDSDTMEAREGEYRHEADQMGQLISNMDRLLAQLQSEWEGEASRSYADLFSSDLRPSLVRTQDLIIEISEALHQTARTMRA